MKPTLAGCCGGRKRAVSGTVQCGFWRSGIAGMAILVSGLRLAELHQRMMATTMFRHRSVH